MKILLISLFIFSLSINCFAYVISKSETGKNVKWEVASESLVLYVNPNPIGNRTSGITSNEVMSIFENSLAEWNQYTDFEMRTVYSTADPSSAKNNVFFTSDTTYFGSGVLAITEINYNVETGTISSADIVVNESIYNVINFTDDETRSSYLEAYLGDVFTHELGHFLGLSHSEVVGSSMIYSVFKNQHTVHNDDISGVLDIYSKILNPGQLSGKVIGGGGTAVFGAHVLLLSSVDGKVVQSQITDEDGTFKFKNLELDHSYYFYVTPFKQTKTISTYYSTAVSEYCPQGSYKGTFFTQCGPRSKGKPQGFGITESDLVIDVGEITIRCDENLVVDYLANKSETVNRSYELNPTLDKFSQVFVGMFTSTEISEGIFGNGDEYTLDLRSVDFGINSPASSKLKLNFTSTGISSMFDFQIEIKRADQGSYTVYTSSVDETGKILTDQEIILDLSGSASNNLFEILVYPVGLSTAQKYEIFSTSSNLSNQVAQYTISSQVGKYVASEFVPYELYVSDSYDDNSLCAEGSINYATQAYTPLTATSDAAQLSDDTGVISCGTIDLDNGAGGSGGPLSFALGFILVFLMSQFRPRIDD